MKKFSDIVKSNITGAKRCYYKKFWQEVSGLKEEKIFRDIIKRYDIRDTDLRQINLIYSFGGKKPLCKTCNKNFTKFCFRDDEARFLPYCSPQCSNKNEEKKNKVADSLMQRSQKEATAVSSFLDKYSKERKITSLSNSVLRRFSKAIKEISDHPKEFDILRSLPEELKKIWATLPANTARGRLELATGIRTIESLSCNSVGCRNLIKDTTFGFGVKKYCCYKCAGKETISKRVTEESIKKATLTNQKRLDSLDKDWMQKNPGKSRTLRDALVIRLKKGVKKKYGVNNPSQLTWVRAKQLASGISTKEWTLGKRKILVQGYEGLALDYLTTTKRFFEPGEIQVESDGKVPSIKYWYKGRNRVYYPDMYVKHEDRIIEVKSLSTASKNIKLWNLLKRKRQAVIDSGYKFTLLIMKHNGDRLKTPKGWWDMKLSEFRSRVSV